MCLILFAINPSPRYRLVVAANRDELFARPTKQADFWSTHPSILAGIDKNMGGTWLGINRRGHFAAVTNFREDPPEPIPPRSRGDLPANFLIEQPDPGDYVQDVSLRGLEYRGFNLIVANENSCHYYGNRAGDPRQLDPGFYGLSNQVLDCNWPKVVDGRAKLSAMDFDDPSLADNLFSQLADDGDGREFSNSFIRGDTYGTRAATVVLLDRSGEIYFEERNFGDSGEPIGTSQHRLTVQA